MSDLSVRPLDPSEPVFDPSGVRVKGALDGPAEDAAGALQDIKPAFDDLKFAAPASAIARASLATNTPTRIKRYATSLGKPESDFAEQEGNIIRRLGPDEVAPQIYQPGLYGRVEPSVSGGHGFADTAERLGKWMSGGAGPAIPATASGVAAILTAPSLAGSMMAGGAAAAGAEGLRQIADKALAGEPLVNFDWMNEAGQAALGLAQPLGGVVLGKAASAIGTGLKGGAKIANWALGKMGAGQTATIDDLAEPAAAWLKTFTHENPLDLTAPAWSRLRGSLTPEALADIHELRANAARNGVDLSLDQLTGNYALFQRMRQLMRYPETSNDVYQFERSQRIDQIPQAFLAKINELLPQGAKMAPEDMIAAFRKGADNVVTKALEDRSKEAKTAFRMALDDNPERYWTPELDDLMQRPSVRAGIAHAKKIAAERGDTITVPAYENGKIVSQDVVPDWRSWHYIKQGIDRVIESNTNEFGRVNSYGNAVAATKRELMGILGKRNPQYIEALGKYGKSSEALDMILDGGPGFLRRMEGMDRQQIVDRVFSSDNLMATDVAKMRQNFVDAGATDEWENGFHAYLRGKLNDALTPMRHGGQPGNTAGKLFGTAWGDPDQQSVIRAAFGDPAKAESYSKFMDVLQAASKFAAEGSPTATDLGPGKSAMGNTMRAVAKMFDVSTYANLGTTVGDGIASMFDRNYRTKMLDYMLTDQGEAMLKQMARIKPSSLAARQLLGQIFVEAGVVKSGVGQDSGGPRPWTPIPTE